MDPVYRGPTVLWFSFSDNWESMWHLSISDGEEETEEERASSIESELVNGVDTHSSTESGGSEEQLIDTMTMGPLSDNTTQEGW